MIKKNTNAGLRNYFAVGKNDKEALACFWLKKVDKKLTKGIYNTKNNQGMEVVLCTKYWLRMTNRTFFAF